MATASSKLSFAAAYDELQQITREFEQGELDLEKSIPKFKRASELVKFLQGELKKMETQIEEINLDSVKVPAAPTKSVEPRLLASADGPDQTEIPF